MALTKTAGQIVDWTALASGTAVVAGQLDVSDAYSTTIVIQAMIDAETPHTGTEFIIQGRASTTDTNQDWYDIGGCRFVDLVHATPQVVSINEDIAVDEAEGRVEVDENPATLITVGAVDGPLPWVGLEDTGDVTASEMVLAWDGDANEIWVLPSNEGGTEFFESVHANDDSLCSIAMSKGVTIGIDHYRVRVVINNNYDINGATINYRLGYVKVTAL